LEPLNFEIYMYLDLTHPFTNQMPVFPGDPQPELTQVSTVQKDGIAHFDLKTGMHVGTHMDAPAHMLAGGKNLSEYLVEKFFGRGVILDARGKKSADVNLLDGVDVRRGDIVLVCFGWSTEFKEDEYYLNYPEISGELAKKLADIGISVVGMDTPSPDRAPYGIHNILFKGDVLIIENLTNLETLIGKTNFEITALPIKLETEAAPCRVVAKVF
jgi:arylformamidase